MNDDEREALRLHGARSLWENGWGRGRSFEQYLSDVPPPPPRPRPPPFNTLILVDSRLDLLQACIRLKVGFSVGSSFFMQPLPIMPVYWMWCQTGADYMGISPEDWLQVYSARQVPLTAMEGLCMHAQRPDIVKERFVDLPGSIHFGNLVASLGFWTYDKVWLHWIAKSENHRRCGCASRAPLL